MARNKIQAQWPLTARPYMVCVEPCQLIFFYSTPSGIQHLDLTFMDRRKCLCSSCSPDSVSLWVMAKRNIQEAQHVAVHVQHRQDVIVNAAVALLLKMKMR